MMIFDYVCDSCETTFEKFISYYDRDNIKCPDCSDFARRVLSVPNFRLDGTDPAFPTAHEKWAKHHETEGRKRDPS